MEYEVRFYYPLSKKDELLKKLISYDNLIVGERKYEKTTQYDHPCIDNSFYSKNIDGRFRIRVIKSDKESSCKVSWKRRLPNTIATSVNKEEEIELSIKFEEYENLIFLIDNVLKMKNVESYERYRTLFYNDDIEISIDEYPFGIALEIENKGTKLDPESNVKQWVDIIGLDLSKAYRLSWDDKYTELCKEQGIEHFSNVSFGLPMPQVLE